MGKKEKSIMSSWNQHIQSNDPTQPNVIAE